MDQKNKNTLLVAILALFITACKKYPENNVWFRNTSKSAILMGYLQKYDVNDVDSLELLNHYFPIHGNSGLIRDVKQCEFKQYVNHGRINGNWNLGGTCNLTTIQDIISNGKKIKIYCEQNSACFGKNIFIDANIEWTIMNFPTKKKPILKIKTTLENGNTYKIQIGR
jgi:hypothetical protein